MRPVPGALGRDAGLDLGAADRPVRQVRGGGGDAGSHGIGSPGSSCSVSGQPRRPRALPVRGTLRIPDRALYPVRREYCHLARFEGYRVSLRVPPPARIGG
ncbi:hypothetical protein GCM10023088_69030 [Actinomadura verrucosospora]